MNAKEYIIQNVILKTTKMKTIVQIIYGIEVWYDRLEGEEQILPSQGWDPECWRVKKIEKGKQHTSAC